MGIPITTKKDDLGTYMQHSDFIAEASFCVHGRVVL